MLPKARMESHQPLFTPLGRLAPNRGLSAGYAWCSMRAMSVLAKWVGAGSGLLLWAGCVMTPTTPERVEVTPDKPVVPAPPLVQLPPPLEIVPAPIIPIPVVPTNVPTPPTVTLPKRDFLPALPSTEWIPVTELGRYFGSAPPIEAATTIPPSYTFAGVNGKLTVTAGKGQVDWNGLNINLGFGPRMIEGQTHLNSLDIVKTLQPLFTDPGENRWKILVLDPGHGGTNTGTTSVLDNTFEKEYTLDWAKRAKPLLEAEGWTVYLTRDRDLDLSLSERVAFADKMHADLFISLHFNSRPLPAPEDHGGLETYTLTPKGMPSNLVRDGIDDLTQEFANNAFDAQNLRLAVQLHQAVLHATGEKDRGVRRARFMGVLRGQNRPAVLLEAAYLSDPKDAVLVETANYRQRLAQALASALAPSQTSCCGTSQ